MSVRGHPAVALMIGAFISALVIGLAAWLTLQTPYLGLSLAPDLAQGRVLIRSVSPDGPAAALRSAVALEAVNGIRLRAPDGAEVPEWFESYEELNAFLARQTDLAAIVRSGPVRLTGLYPGGETRQVEVHPSAMRLQDLPGSFWVQVLTAAMPFLVMLWIWALRPAEAVSKLLVFIGAGLFLEGMSTAIYSSRELALDGAAFRALLLGGRFSAVAANCASVALFLIYPRRLVDPAYLWVLPAISAVWFALDALQVFPGSANSVHALHVFFRTLILVAIILQWRASRGRPIERTALICFGASSLLVMNLFFAIYTLPQLLGKEPVLSRAYFGLCFVPGYIGLAIGISRYRLFELGEWAFRIMFLVAGVVLLLALDAALIFALQLENGLSLGVSLVAVGFLYLPLRDFLWRRLVAGPQMSEGELFQRILEIVLSATSGERAEKWRVLMIRLFNPLEIRMAEKGVPEPEIRADGTELILPQTSVSPSLLLRYPWHGRKLFSPSHLRIVSQALALVERAETSRQAYERGAAEERYRIARDLHDDVGARLLSSLHKPDLQKTRETVRQAMDDLRIVIGQLAGERRVLGEVLADLRLETIERVETAGLMITWFSFGEDEIPLDYATSKSLVSATREVISNIIRHAEAARVEVTVQRTHQQLELTIADDGIGLPSSARHGRTSGLGLQSIAQRLAALGGEMRLEGVQPGTRVTLIFPLPGPRPDRPSAHEEAEIK